MNERTPAQRVRDELRAKVEEQGRILKALEERVNGMPRPENVPDVEIAQRLTAVEDKVRHLERKQRDQAKRGEPQGVLREP